MDPANIFRPETSYISSHFTNSRAGYYIPSYQRYYTWDYNHIDYFFENICLGLNSLPTLQNALTFIGTFILINDNEHETIEPSVRSQLPDRVNVVIDGQQRISTIIMISIFLHNSIKFLKNKLGNLNTEPKIWLDDFASEVNNKLKNVFMFDYGSGEDEFHFYPKLIRALEDQWAKTRALAKYSSPLAHLQSSYIKYLNDGDAKRFKYSKPDDTKYDVVVNAIKRIDRNIKYISDDNNSSFDVLGIDKYCSDIELQKLLFRDQLTDEVIDTLLDDNNNNFRKLFLQICFAQYLTTNVIFTIITTNKDEYAFDIFESVNTSGEPLTAIETLKPRVVKAEGAASYEASESRKWLNKVDEYLNQFKKADDRQKATSDILVPFALSETGTKQSRNLNAQRKYLNVNYNGLNSLENKRIFLRNMSFTIDAINIINGNVNNTKLESWNNDHTEFFVSIIKVMNHNIVISLITRLYENYLLTEDDGKEAVKNDIEDMISRIGSFFVIWRCSRYGTDRIDDIYRTLLRTGDEDINIGAQMALKEGNYNTRIEIEAVKKFMSNRLMNQGGIIGKERFIEKATKLPLYDLGNKLAKIVLLISMDGYITDDAVPGMLKKATPGVTDTATSDWITDEEISVEHIAPQTKKEGWEEELYSDSELIHTIGNLTLLPKCDNSRVGNKGWDSKRLYYKMLSSESADERSTLIEEINKNGFNITEPTQKILENAKYFPVTKTLSNYEDQWDKDIIERRSKQLYENVWDYLEKWLIYEED